MAGGDIMLIDNVSINYPKEISKEEAEIYAREELGNWQKKGIALAKIEIKLVGEEVEIKAYEKSPITRVRRITGYLSKVTNFNDSKKAELKSRVAHLVS